MHHVKALCAEMGLKYDEMLSTTWVEFDYYQTGHNRKVERLWDVGRHLMATMFNSSGFSKQKVKPRDIMELPMLDNMQPKKEFKRVPKEALERLKKVI